MGNSLLLWDHLITQIFPISLLSSSVHSLSPKFSCPISSFSSFIVSIVLCSLALASSHCLQFLSNLAQYSLSYLLSNQPNSFLAVNFPSSSLLNVPFFLFYLLISSISCQYSFSNSSTASFVFSRFSIPSQVSDSAVNLFYCTRYLSFPLTHCLFSILSTSHSFSPSIITRADCSFLCPSTCPTYLCILLMFTTGCILIILDSSNLTAFTNMIFLTL